MIFMVIKFLPSRGQNAHRKKLMVFVTLSFTGFTNRCLGFLRIVDVWNFCLVGKELHTMKKCHASKWIRNQQIRQWFSGEIHNLAWSKFLPSREGYAHREKKRWNQITKKSSIIHAVKGIIEEMKVLKFLPCREGNFHDEKMWWFRMSHKSSIIPYEQRHNSHFQGLKISAL